MERAHHVTQIAGGGQVAGIGNEEIAAVDGFHVGRGRRALHHRQPGTVKAGFTAQVLLVGGAGLHEFGGSKLTIYFEHDVGRRSAGRGGSGHEVRAGHDSGLRGHGPNALDAHIDREFPSPIELLAPHGHVLAGRNRAVVLQHGPGPGGVAHVARLGGIGQYRVPAKLAAGTRGARSPHFLGVGQLTIFNHQRRRSTGGQKRGFRTRLCSLGRKYRFGGYHHIVGRLTKDHHWGKQGNGSAYSQLILHSTQVKGIPPANIRGPV